MVFGGRKPSGLCRLVDPISHAATDLTLEELAREIGGQGAPDRPADRRRRRRAQRRSASAGSCPRIWRYRRPLGHVLAASLFVQIFALTTPLFFQVIVDKVLTHRGYETLFVLVAGLVVIGLFDVALQYLRTYALSHTTNRIDVELGQRLFAHLLRLPMSYFETRPAGQTVARVRELETIRTFLTGQGLFSAIDLVFAFVFVARPVRLFGAAHPDRARRHSALPADRLRRPAAACATSSRRSSIAARRASSSWSRRSSASTRSKSAAVEPMMRAQWEEKLAAYVKTSFAATMLGTGGQLAIQYVSKLTTAALLLFGAKAVIDGELTVGALVAFNMIAVAGGPADPAPVADLAGLPAGADLDRAAGRHPQRAARACAADAARCRRRRAARSNSATSASAIGPARRRC